MSTPTFETVITRGNLSVVVKFSTEKNFLTTTEDDRKVLAQILKVAPKLSEPVKVRFDELAKFLAPTSTVDEAAMALKILAKRATPATASAVK
jgi:hypothetical protein